MVDPMILRQTSPEDLYSKFSKIAMNTTKDLQNFATLMRQDQSQTILNHARRRTAENPEGIRNWMITDHEYWLDVPKDGLSKDLTGAELSA